MSPKITPHGLVYLATKYPLLSETFIYEEILTLKNIGYDVNFFVLHSTGGLSHEFMKDLDDNVYFLPSLFSLKAFLGNIYFLFLSPKSYFLALITIIWKTYFKPILMVKNIYAFVKGVMLAYILKDYPQKHIHSHWATLPTTVAYVASKLLRVQYSFTSHAWDIFKEPTMLDVKLESASFHTTISEYNNNYLQKIIPTRAEKIFVNRCGININHFAFRSIYQKKTPIEILFVGRLVPKKGVISLIEACKQLYDGGDDFICNIIGDGPQKSEAQNLISKLNLQGKVRLLGGLPREKLHYYWQNASMFVLPCEIEKNGNRDGIPVVLMEAMVSGIPVISTNISGIPELIEDGITGLLISPGDINGLKIAIQKIMEDSILAQRLVDNAHEKIIREYNISINASKKAELFEMSIAKGSEYDT